MASLEQRNGIYRVIFRYRGDKFSRSLRTRSRTAATASVARLEDNLRRLELGTLAIPPDADVACFLLSDGRARAKRNGNGGVRYVGELLDRYLDNCGNGSVESSTRSMLEIHVRHLKRVLGTRLRVGAMAHEVLQGYIEKRSTAPGTRSSRLSPSTIKKELVTLGAAWKWAQNAGLIDRPLPKAGLRFPKTQEKPPFQTWAEIERKIKRGGLTEMQQAELWDCLFLTLPEIEELLDYVTQHARHSFIYPMFVFAAHTGARRSELMRSQISDVDLEAATVLIREKKRVRGKLTTRSVPLSPLLCNVMKEWIEDHPGGNTTFCFGTEVRRSKKKRELGTELTRDEANDHFKRTVKGSKWQRLRGWHVFRHSFCSNCAAAGIDQRIINTWVGHQTEEMVRCYRHLIPNQEQAAIRQVFASS